MQIHCVRLILFAFWLLPWSAKAQDTCAFLFSVSQSARFATADQFSNIYLLAAGNAVEKYDSTGKFASRYSNNRLGAAAFVDASNPLKILVWYAGFQTAIFLDRNLTELGRLNVAEAGWPAVRCIASAADGNLWVYDEATSHLHKLSAAGEKLMESQPLNLAFAQSFAPACIRDDGGQAIFLSDPAQGVAVFDAFAQWDKALPVLGLRQFEVENGLLVFAEKGEIRVEHERGFFSKKIALPEVAKTEGAIFWISKRRLFVQTNSGVEVYRF